MVCSVPELSAPAPGSAVVPVSPVLEVLISGVLISTCGCASEDCELSGAGSTAAGRLNRLAITTVSATHTTTPDAISSVLFVLSFIEFCLLFHFSVDIPLIRTLPQKSAEVY